MRLLAYISSVISLVLCSGCGSFYGRMYGPPAHVYSGVRADTWLAFQGQPKHPLFVIDYPFSAIVDTLLLPVDLWPESPPLEPLKGWKPGGEVGCKNGEMSAEISPIPGYKEISDDVQKFVNKLPVDHSPYGTRRWCYWIEDMRFYEDGTGQHAVGFQIPHDGTWWGYVLIYDKNNKRVKAVRYVQGHYMS